VLIAVNVSQTRHAHLGKTQQPMLEIAAEIEPGTLAPRRRQQPLPRLELSGGSSSFKFR
jgi:hypothetical protein